MMRDHHHHKAGQPAIPSPHGEAPDLKGTAMADTTKGRRPGNAARCPHCDTTCRTAKSVQVTRTVRHITYVCQNQDCGHVFQAELVAVRTLAPSSTPRADVHIPEKSSA